MCESRTEELALPIVALHADVILESLIGTGKILIAKFGVELGRILQELIGSHQFIAVGHLIDCGRTRVGDAGLTATRLGLDNHNTIGTP